MMKGKTTKATQRNHTPMVAKIILLCDVPAGSIMVRYIDQQRRTELEHGTTIGVDEFKDFFTVHSDGFFEAK
jgi:hypothetical protein